jgi:hypothetical protein
MFKIDKDLPLRSIERRTSAFKAFCDTVNAGDSFFVPLGNYKSLASLRGSYYSKLTKYFEKHRQGLWYHIRLEDQGVRIWFLGETTQ